MIVPLNDCSPVLQGAGQIISCQHTEVGYPRSPSRSDDPDDPASGLRVPAALKTAPFAVSHPFNQPLLLRSVPASPDMPSHKDLKNSWVLLSRLKGSLYSGDLYNKDCLSRPFQSRM